MHCSVCRKPDHNRRGHEKYMQSQQGHAEQGHAEQGHAEQGHAEESVLEEEDDPNILEHIFRQIPNPQQDPTHQAESMIYRLGQEVYDFP